MGAVNFSLDKRLVEALKLMLPLKVLVETGTFQGDTLANLQDSFEILHSIELSPQYHQAAVTRFAGASHIHLHQGESSKVLLQLRSTMETDCVLYFLDAHWCVAANTAGEASQCPLLDELRAIGQLNTESVVLIDDARLFLAPPLAPHEISQWPNFHQITAQLLAISPHHEIMVVNDVIAFFPSRVKHAMASYAQVCGVDWLVAANCLKDNGSFMQQLEEKESVIQLLKKAAETSLSEGHAAELAQVKQQLLEKEEVIRTLAKAVLAFRLAFVAMFPLRLLLMPFGVVARHVRAMLRPRIGDLNQYPPQKLTVLMETKTIAQIDSTLKISIVTPSFQQGQFIEQTLLSVLDQKYPNLEYFVQDGGSKDGTVDILKRFSDQLSGWTSKKDSGQSQAINLGFTNTSGEIMAWLNSDDLLLPGTLATVADYFNRHPDVDVVYGNRLLIDQNGLEIGRWILPGHDAAVLSWVDYVPQETLFWRRRIWEKAGGRIDESFRFAMDWDLLVRFREAGAKFAHLPRFMGGFRIHKQQKTSASINDVGHMEMNRIRERLHGRIPTQIEIRKEIIFFLLKHIIFDLAYRIQLRLGYKL